MFGALNETFQQIDGVALLWKGRLDSYKITDAGATLSVEVTGESRAIDQRRPAIKRFTDEYQQRKYPGDPFFEYVPGLTEVSILWAKAEQSAAPVGGGSGGAAEPAAGAASITMAELPDPDWATAIAPSPRQSWLKATGRDIWAELGGCPHSWREAAALYRRLGVTNLKDAVSAVLGPPVDLGHARRGRHRHGRRGPRHRPRRARRMHRPHAADRKSGLRVAHQVR
jgi:hypothetical protein